VYESPIKTSAGSVHFGNTSDNYFAHSRIEDMADSQEISDRVASQRLQDEEGIFTNRPKYTKSGGDTRRVIEIQSDLFQKGRLEGEASTKRMVPSDNPKYAELESAYKKLQQRDDLPQQEKLAQLSGIKREMESVLDDFNAPAIQARESELSNLQIVWC